MNDKLNNDLKHCDLYSSSLKIPSTERIDLRKRQQSVSVRWNESEATLSNSSLPSRYSRTTGPKIYSRYR